MNSLGKSLSPYLRQHAANPVDWHEWGPQAFAEARRRDVPILLSVGYAACHWCHVMARESFENHQVALALNENFVSIKVDREERPDIDAVYMQATQALTGHGGWPMTVFLTPEGTPLFAGTYFPKDQFLQVIHAITGIWRDERTRAESTAAAIVEALADSRQREKSSGGFGDAELSRAVRQLRHEFDAVRGGFGGAPKFPPAMTLEHLLRYAARTGDGDALGMVRKTLDAMGRGGLYDQLDGGFARYSVDAEWIVPHFEKMLYDNAQLLRTYAHFAHFGDSVSPRIVQETAHFLLTRLRTREGAFASSLDADAAGVEGSTYVWSPQQLREVLGQEDGDCAARLLSVTPTGTFEHGASTLQLPLDPDEALADTAVETSTWWPDVRARLLQARQRRPQPALDDKVVTAWNGLVIAALAEAGMIMSEPSWLTAAETAARFLFREHVVNGRLRRTSLDGEVSAALAGADDYGDFAEGLLVLHQATGDPAWLTAATDLLDDAGRLFIEGDAVFDTGSDAETLFARPRSTGDNAEPSGAAALASAYVMAFALTGRPRYRELALTCTAQLDEVARQAPRFAGWALATAEALAAGPMQVAVVVPAPESGEPHSAQAEAVRAFTEVVWGATSPGLVRVVGHCDEPGVPLLEGRAAIDGQVTAYVCRGFVCDAPIVDLNALQRALA